MLLRALNQFSVAEISSSLARGQRQKVLEDFRDGTTRVLICSDQMARGMDVKGVSCVVNYEPPRQFRVYLHRAGRTARAGQRGVVCTLLAQDEVHVNNKEPFSMNYTLLSVLIRVSHSGTPIIQRQLDQISKLP